MDTQPKAIFCITELEVNQSSCTESSKMSGFLLWAGMRILAAVLSVVPSSPSTVSVLSRFKSFPQVNHLQLLFLKIKGRAMACQEAAAFCEMT